MKNLFLSLGFLLTAHSALACSNPEAQFEGVVTNHQEYTSYEVIIECYYNIKFTDYKTSGVCGLDEQAAKTAEFFDAKCSLKDGDLISGYLVLDQDGQIVVEKKAN